VTSCKMLAILRKSGRFVGGRYVDDMVDDIANEAKLVFTATDNKSERAEERHAG
jgi:hypothetical protein